MKRLIRYGYHIFLEWRWRREKRKRRREIGGRLLVDWLIDWKQNRKEEKIVKPLLASPPTHSLFSRGLVDAFSCICLLCSFAFFWIISATYLTRLFYVSFMMREMGHLLFPLFLFLLFFFTFAALDVLIVGVGRASFIILVEVTGVLDLVRGGKRGDLGWIGCMQIGNRARK